MPLEQFDGYDIQFSPGEYAPTTQMRYRIAQLRVLLTAFKKFLWRHLLCFVNG